MTIFEWESVLNIYSFIKVILSQGPRQQKQSERDCTIITIVNGN